MEVKTFMERPCLECDGLFQPVDWLPHRVAGYCSKPCQKTRTERLARLANENALAVVRPEGAVLTSSSA